MLLKLIPASQEPTIHFSLSFAELPSTLPTPSSWTAQLSQLMHEDLEVPATLHSLDRAAGIPSLLEEVSLDVEMKEIRCRYVDGSVERITFGLRGPRTEQRLMDALASIVRDVRDSTLEDERVMKAREWERQRTRSASVSATPSLSLKTGRQGKHKKQRSLFMHIVSCVGSIVNLASPSSTSHPSIPFYSRSNSRAPISNLPGTAISDSAEPNTFPNTPILPSPGSSPRARALRRAARSALVDTFRQFVLGELVRRFYAGSNTRVSTDQEVGPYTPVYKLENHHQRERGGFCVWILHSMRRRALERMEQILEEAGPAPPEVLRFSEEAIPGFCPTTMDVPLSFSDEEDEEPMAESPVSMDEKVSGDERFPLDAKVDMMQGEAEETSTQSSSSMVDNQVESYPKRPALSPRRASSTSSVATDDSSESGSTNRSTSSISTVSTAPSSIESDSDLKEDTPPTPPAKDVPLSLYQPQYSLQHPPYPCIHHLGPAARNEYTQLYDLRTRLGQLVQFAASQSRVAADEVRNRLDVLMVRSRRRAWLNKALKGPLILKGKTGTSMFGLATPFRSSPLARYMFTADDLARRTSAISRSACSSTLSLSSSYFRTVSSTSSSSSSTSTSSLSKSTSPFPSCRPKIRPKIDYSAALANAIVDFSGSEVLDHDVGTDDIDVNGLTTTTAASWDGMDGDEAEEDAQTVDEFELSQEVKSPSRARRHHRQTIQEVMLSSMPPVPSKTAGGLLFPVSEELEHEDDEFTLALSVRGRGRGRGKGELGSAGERNAKIFMGCEEVGCEDEYADSDDSGASDTSPDLEMGLDFDVDMDCVHDDMEMGLNVVGSVARPQIRPRVRTTSMMGALLRGAKRSLGGGIKQQQQLSPQNAQTALAMDSLLCRPLPAHQPQPQPQPKLIVQSTTPSNANTQSLALMHASNRRAMDLVRSPVSTIHGKMEIDTMDVDVEMNVHLRISEYEYSTGVPLPLVKSLPQSNSIDTELQLQSQHASDEFTLAMDVPQRRAGSTGTRRRRDIYYSPRHEASRRPKLNSIFQGASDRSAC